MEIFIEILWICANKCIKAVWSVDQTAMHVERSPSWVISPMILAIVRFARKVCPPRVFAWKHELFPARQLIGQIKNVAHWVRVPVPLHPASSRLALERLPCQRFCRKSLERGPPAIFACRENAATAEHAKFSHFARFAIDRFGHTWLQDAPKALAGCKSKTRQGPEESVSTKTSKWKLFFPGNPGIPFSTTCRSCISKV